MERILSMAKKARTASIKLGFLETEVKNKALHGMADALVAKTDLIVEANQKDMEQAKKKRISLAMMDRLMLNESRIEGMAESLRDVAALKDPVGEVVRGWKRPNGLTITQVRTSLGVIGMVYEARPNVTSDAAGLCLKSGNAALMRGGSEAINSNVVIAHILADAANKAGVPEGAIQMAESTDREIVMEMLKLREYIDLIIPRGGEGLIKTVVENSTIPVLKHFKGLCHTYVDETADLDMAVKIVDNAKTQRPSTCNSLETLLVNFNVAAQFLPKLKEKLDEKKVEFRGDKRVREILPDIKKATEIDWKEEYLDLILSIKVVDGLDEAITHITEYSSGLAEAIITEDYTRSKRFLDEIDSACVFVNTSIRFTDGGQFGLGAEIGITTDKVFPRGPMGLEALTSTKYVVYGTGQVRQ